MTQSRCVARCAVAPLLAAVALSGGSRHCRQVLDLTIYEDTDPEDLSKKVGTMYGLNDGQQAKLAQTIEKNMVPLPRQARLAHLMARAPDPALECARRCRE